MARLDGIARETKVAIIAGFAEAAQEATYNSAVFVDGRNRPVIYRKSHLYGAYERALFAAGAPCACGLLTMCIL
ncbi:nitrilase-related carbon-nitrogen hydrolase [Chelativorans intermedius]|uniref:Nitrilase-related carbon-nitrogen hydrolase n=1 Tax=Chelativorans intermedius TaxID=515947 RepID=A0ABV6D5X2_9HYPH|nr:nitrilase-related carbon-nitrogen hydrolase [Chelativorans intermedius]MCT8997496.1 hypothetical protein [Chelativorans intermedius]